MTRTKSLFLAAAVVAACLVGTRDADAYRAVQNGSFIENGEYLPFTLSEDRQLHDEIVWLAGPSATLPVNVCVLDSIGTDAFWFSVLWASYDALHPDAVVTRIIARPVTEALLDANTCEVAVLSNAWHGPPAEVPGAFPGGGDWVFRQAEGDQIAQWLTDRDTGLLITAGSFGQFAKSGPDSNYASFAATMGVQSTLGGTPGCDRAFPWSRGTGCYPNTEPASTHVINDPSHPIVTSPIGIPGVYGVSFTTARATWMGVAGATRVGTVTGPTTSLESLTTAFESQAGIEVTDLTCVDYPFKGHPTVCWVTAHNPGAADVPLDAAGLTFEGNSSSWARETLQFGMDDTNGTPGLDPDGYANWTAVLTLPLGPPDSTYTVVAKVCAGSGCGTLAKPLTSDSCKHNTTDPGDLIDEYRHFQKAVIFTRTAWRNGDTRVAAALDLIKLQTDDGYKDAHTLVSNTSPGPGAYNLELIHENLDEGNCQFGVTGDWLHDL